VVRPVERDSCPGPRGFSLVNWVGSRIAPARSVCGVCGVGSWCPGGGRVRGGWTLPLGTGSASAWSGPTGGFWGGRSPLSAAARVDLVVRLVSSEGLLAHDVLRRLPHSAEGMNPATSGGAPRSNVANWKLAVSVNVADSKSAVSLNVADWKLATSVNVAESK
jgi:hypothetical protein